MKIINVLLPACLLLCYTLAAQTTYTKTIHFGGLTREYRLYVPASYHAAVAAPLVLNLHGYTSNNLQQEFYGDFRPIADTAGFLIAHPNGTADTGGNLYWNAGFVPGGVDDLGFLTALIDTISANYHINPRRVYTTGMSNGGIMSYYLACHSNRFAAIASVTGTLTKSGYNTCTPTKPTPIMEIHGTADPTVPYNGTTTFVSIDSMMRYWVAFNHCNATPTTANVPNTNLTDGATAIHYTYTGGTDGVTVEHYKIVNGAHTWPGAPITIGVTCMDFSASKEIWRFFNQYRLITDTDNVLNKATNCTIIPNPAQASCTVSTANYEKGNLQLLDLQGKILLQQTYEGNAQTISLRGLPAGIYLVNITTPTNSFYQKLIINNY